MCNRNIRIYLPNIHRGITTANFFQFYLFSISIVLSPGNITIHFISFIFVTYHYYKYLEELLSQNRRKYLL